VLGALVLGLFGGVGIFSARSVLAVESDLTWWSNEGISVFEPLPVLSPLLPGFEPSEQISPHVRAPLTEDVLAVAKGNNQFALDIYRQLALAAEPDKNLLVSPFSISTALAMTYAGARGRTAQQMAEVLRFNLPDNLLHGSYGELIEDLTAEREGYELNVANRLFGQQGFQFKQPFLDTVANGYQAPLESLDFRGDPESARTYINDWVEDQTNDRIKNLLPEGSVQRETALVLTNAVYFDGDWKYQFNKQATRDDIFTAADGSESTVPMMFQEQSFRYAQLDNFQILEMPYAGDDLSMVVMLPSEADGLADLEASLTNELLDTSLEAMRNQKVQVHLPKFTFDDSFNLKGVLTDMGMEDAFTGAADFSGMADGGDLSISGVLHKTFIDVSEEGTEAAAATGVIVGITDITFPTPPPVFRADQPFLFALRDTSSGSLLFMGRVTQPGELVAASVTVPEPSTVLLLFVAVLVCGRGPRQ